MCLYSPSLFTIGVHVLFTLASNACNRCPELVIYADAELQVVESELFSLQKVMVKLESEMKQAMDTEGKFCLFFFFLFVSQNKEQIGQKNHYL